MSAEEHNLPTLHVVSRGGTRVERLAIDGVDVVDHARRLAIVMGVGRLHEATLDLTCRGGLDITLAATVTVAIEAAPGYVIDVTQGLDGARRYRSKRVPDEAVVVAVGHEGQPSSKDAQPKWVPPDWHHPREDF